jgi:hypothetical protein
MAKVVIVDVDGTIADCSSRADKFLALSEKPDWDGFYSDIATDKPIEPVLDLVDLLFERYWPIFLTGRSEKYRPQTEAWLKRYLGDSVLERAPLYMRAADDHRPDEVVKAEIFLGLDFKKDEVAFVLEDRDRVVKMWRGLGVQCLQVAEGDF